MTRAAEPVSVTTADGRALHAISAGPDDGELLIFHHGTPGSAHGFWPHHVETAGGRGIRLAAYSRPGGPGSDRVEGRKVADCAADAAAVADALGAERFYTLGASGGGPHSLACAALLGERVIAAGTIAGVAPFGAEGLDWLAGMGKENHDEIGAAQRGPAELREWLLAKAGQLRSARGEQVVEALGDLVGEADRAVLNGEYGEFLAAGVRDSVGSGVDGWFDDDYALIGPWGFEVESIARPVSLWQGDDDRFVPIAHGRWLAARMPQARVHLLEGHGHLSIMLGHFGEVLDDLREAGRWPGNGS